MSEPGGGVAELLAQLTRERAALARDRATLIAELRTIRTVRQRLEATARRSRKPETVNAAIMAALVAALPLGDPFYVADALRRSDEQPALRAALEAHGVNTASHLGSWLRDVSGQPIGAHRIVRAGRDRGGVTWSIAAVSGEAL